ncbi:hypothetical protein GCM10011391_18130 [Pullulanibacillus camelliae]|uniref:Uncharacterized protein n=1 Tax=Pullulanibacillus camelliae TaxID=1707096 RepID=A0A8J2YH14_9BACL|nr:hypothetical protein GCM10011391_18130 [Pullulanibacillus camelliae]
MRLDARGNKKGVNAQFSLSGEQRAFSVNKALGEKDYPMIYVAPHPKTVAVLQEQTDTLVMYKRHLPTCL